MIVEAREDTVRLYGNLLENQWLPIKAVANLLLKEHPRGIIIDCTHLEEVQEQGAETFLQAIQYIESADARMVVANLPEDILSDLRAIPGLRSRLPVAASVDEARRSLEIGGSSELVTTAPESTQGILVPLLSEETGEHATTTACRLGRDARSDIHLAYLLVVPRAHPLNTPMAEEEEHSEVLLDACEAIVRRFGLRAHRHTLRTRDRNEGILQLVESLRVETLVLSRAGHSEEDTTEAVLQRAQCEVIVDQVPAAD